MRRGVRTVWAWGLVAALLCAPWEARAFGPTGAFSFAILKHEGNHEPRPGGLKRVAWEVAKRTSVEVVPEPAVLLPTDPELFRRPFVVLAGDGDFPPLGDAGREALRRYLNFGGMLIVDDASGQPGGAFDRAARREVAAILPASKVAPVAKTHVLFKSFYLLDGPVGRVQASSTADGVELGGRLAVVFSPNDLAGAAARDQFGTWEHEVTPGGETQRERAFRWGVNLVMYALCLDYKDDQVHVPFIMKRRR